MFLKRQRFWLLALVLALAAVPIYRLAFPKTNTARCKYDQITGQMTVEDVKALLGEASWDLGNSYGWTDDSWTDEEGGYMIQFLNVEFSNSVAVKRLYRLDQMTEDTSSIM